MITLGRFACLLTYGVSLGEGGVLVLSVYIIKLISNKEEDEENQKMHFTSNSIQVHEVNIQYPNTITHHGNIILYVLIGRSYYSSGAFILMT